MRRTLQNNEGFITSILSIANSWILENSSSVSLLTPYKENEIHGLTFPKPPPDLINEEEEYEITQILKHHGTPKNHFYLI